LLSPPIASADPASSLTGSEDGRFRAPVLDRKGAELIAAKWTDDRNVPQITFKPDWTRPAKAAPFKRDDAMLETLPIGVHALSGNGHPGQSRRQDQERFGSA
jgi:hypothetical protein